MNTEPLPKDDRIEAPVRPRGASCESSDMCDAYFDNGQELAVAIISEVPSPSTAFTFILYYFFTLFFEN